MQFLGWQALGTVSVRWNRGHCASKGCRGAAFLLFPGSSLDPWGVPAAWALHPKESNNGLGKRLNEKPGFRVIS